MLSCFKIPIQDYWLGGTKGKIGDDKESKYLFVAIDEDDENWWLNKCILRSWAFDYEAFEALPFEIECECYGVYVIAPKQRA